MPIEVPVVWAFGARGNWDHGMVLSALDRSLYDLPTTYKYVEHTSLAAAEDAGCVAIFPGEGTFRANFLREMKDFVSGRPWVIVIILSDEGAMYPWQYAKVAHSQVWIQMPRPGTHGAPQQVEHSFPAGPPLRLAAAARDLPMPAAERKYLWSFAGQAPGDNERRQACTEALEVLPPELTGWCLSTPGFAQGLPYDEYLESLRQSAIVPCPAGACTADSFRLWESLEMGALPIADTRATNHIYPQNDYWSYTFRCAPADIPFPRLEDWSRIGDILRMYANDRVRLQHDTNKAVAWWLGQKRAFVARLDDDVTRMRTGGGVERVDGVTVLVPVGPADIAEATATLAEIRADAEFSECEVFFLVSEVHPLSAEHEEHKRQLLWHCNWDPAFRRCLPVLLNAAEADPVTPARDLMRTTHYTLAQERNVRHKA